MDAVNFDGGQNAKTLGGEGGEGGEEEEEGVKRSGDIKVCDIGQNGTRSDKWGLRCFS